MISGINVLIQLIGVFSIYNFLKKYNIYNLLIKKKIDKKLIFVKKGEEIIIYDLEYNKFIKNKIHENIFSLDINDYDFILLKDNNNIIRYKNIKDFKENCCYTKTNKIFLSLKLVVDNKSYNLNLNNPNFYILNNLLFDYEFIKWYSNNILNININLENNYYILILDNQVKEYKLNKFNSIIIKKNNYEIINNMNILNNIK